MCSNGFRMKGDNISERLQRFGAAIVMLVRKLSSDRAGKLMQDQLLRAGTAGGSNYEEARSAQSRRDFVHKVSLAAKEMRESLYWLAVVVRTEPELSSEAANLKQEGTELVAILMKSASTAQQKETSGTKTGYRGREPAMGTGNTN